jgi:hypothetical protein
LLAGSLSLFQEHVVSKTQPRSVLFSGFRFRR